MGTNSKNEGITEDELVVKLQEMIDKNIEPSTKSKNVLAGATTKSCKLGQIDLCREVVEFTKYEHKITDSKSKNKVKGIIHRRQF